MEVLMSINERLFYLLDNCNISQKEFSNLTGIPSQTISGWKNRKTDPPSSLIPVIANFFGVSCDFILTGSLYENSSNSNKEFHDLIYTFSLLSESDKREILEFMKLKIRLSSNIT